MLDAADIDITIRRLSALGRTPLQIALALGGEWSRNSVAAALEALQGGAKPGETIMAPVEALEPPAVAVPPLPQRGHNEAYNDRVYISRPWTSEEDELITSLWTSGEVTMSGIANRLHGRSKNSVIGRIHRLGLKRRQKVAEATAAPGANTPAIAVSHPGSKRLAPNSRLSPNFLATPARLERPISRTAAMVLAGPFEPLRLSLQDIGDDQCRFIVNGYLTAEPARPALYCGLRTVPCAPYCEHHRKLMYAPNPQRRKKPEGSGQSFEPLKTGR